MKTKQSTQVCMEFEANNKPAVHGTVKQSGMTPGEIVIGILTGLDNHANPLVDFNGNVLATAVPAKTTVALKQQHTGRQVALLFDQGNLQKPVIMGLVHSPLQDMLENFEPSVADQTSTEIKSSGEETGDEIEENDLYIDGQRLVLEGKKEIVLKCGDSSITLTKAGKIIIRGKYLLNRSSGVNRIMGGSVQIN